MSDTLASQGLADLLVQNVTDYAIYMLDPAGIVSSWNAGAARFKGYRAEEIIGEHFSRFYTEEDRAAGKPARALQAALEEGRFEAEGWRVRQDGTRFWASVVIDPIRDERGRHVGFAKITRDLTERKAAQEALEQSREQFFQAQKLEAIGRLTGGVAHDFNNILAAIMGSLGLAQRRMAQGEDITRFLDNAMQAAKRGATLTQRMLAFARKQELQLEPVDVIGAVRDMAELLARTIGPNITITTRFPLSVPPVLADKAQLELALMNLVVNARDAMPEGGTITLCADAVEDEHGCPFVRLVVDDEGSGMDAETLARAADPFFTTKGVGKGTGLGLPMVQGMVEQCGGRFRLESELGKGTRAEVWLPVTEAAEEPPADEERREPAAGRPLRILAVDDDPIVLLNTAAVLAEIGHQVIQAHSGPSALTRLAEHPVDLLLTDYAMPGMTGAELVAQAQQAQPGIKAIIVSGYADLPEGAPLAVPRLAKPFSDLDLAKLIAGIAG
jgi:PAS domain S-box-containing protein